MRVADELPASVVERLLDALVTEHQERPARLRRILQHFGELASIGTRRSGDAAELAERRHDIEEVAHRFATLIRGDPGAGDDQGHAHRVFVEVLLADEAVRTAGHAGIRGVDDDRVGGMRRRVDGVEDAPDLHVEEADVAIVLGQHRLDVGLLAGPGQQLFVADDHLAVIERMLGQEVRRQRDRGRRIIDRKALRHDVRVVGSVEGEIGEERLPAVLRLQERERLVGGFLAEVLRGDLRRGELAGRQHVAGRRLEGVGHAAHEERAGLLEGLRQGRRSVMPLAGGEGRITGRAEGVGPGRMPQQLFVDLGEGTAGKQHRARRHAGRALVAALHVGAGESHPALHEPVEVRGLDDRITQRRDGVGPLIVGEDEDDVRGLGGGQGHDHGQQSKGETGQAHGPIQARPPQKATRVQALKP